MDRWIKVVGIIVVLSVALSAAVLAVQQNVETHTATFDHEDLHPEDNMGPVGTDITTGEGNRFSPYLSIVYTDGMWAMEFSLLTDTGEDYEVESFRVDVTVPPEMLIRETYPLENQPVHTSSYDVTAGHGLVSATSTIVLKGDYRDDPPTLQRPMVYIDQIGDTYGPVSCTFTARFIQQGLFGSVVEEVTGTLDVYTDAHSKKLPWE